MTRKFGKTVVIKATAPASCARCEQKTECRDVLGDGTLICFGCATNEEKQTYATRMFGSSEQDIQNAMRVVAAVEKKLRSLK